MSDRTPPHAGPGKWETSSRPEFFEYYAKESASAETVRRYRAIYDLVLRVRRERGGSSTRLKVADIGCGAGTQCLLWAENGHDVYGLDVNEPLLELARQRAAEAGFDVRLEVGSATALPVETGAIDVCLVPELLEHVEDWQSCLTEFARILRPGGILYLSTTNKLCPVQQEFELPLYSWYPGPLKRHYETLARSSRPELANYATYPAVNWFTYRQLQKVLDTHGIETMDRFDAMDLPSKSRRVRWAVRMVRLVRPLRWLAHVASSSTIVVGVRR